MIPLWRQIQKTNFTRLEPLLDYLELPADFFLSRPRFSLNLPRRLAEKIVKGDVKDPILRQFLPSTEESKIVPGFSSQPVCDERFREGGKLLHKYKGRALILTTSACAMHCRFCFRQNFPYETEAKGFSAELDVIKNAPDLSEIILSGGDPLSLSDESLSDLLSSLEKFPHIRRIRFHTRFPIGIPERIDENFLKLLKISSKQIIFVIHVNHPKELDHEVLSSLKKLREYPLLNQSTLLKGVNDEETTLLNLCEKLADHGILPYYLHALDPVEGAAHFAVSDERGRELIQYLQAHLSGYAVPRFVREIPGASSKTGLCG